MPLEVARDVYYVYHHIIGETVFYVGKGVSDRPFEIMKRTPLWHSKVDENNGMFDVKLVGSFTCDKEARAFEANEIKRLKSSANQKCNGYTRLHTAETIEKLRQLGKGRKVINIGCGHKSRWPRQPIQDIDTGKIYQSMSAAAKEFGLSASSISAHIKHNSYHIRGKRFRIYGEVQENNRWATA